MQERASDYALAYLYRGKHRLRSNTVSKATVATTVGISSLVGIPTVAMAAPDSVWDRLAECESSGNWSINTGNGYSGGLQFSPTTWDAFREGEFAESAFNATREQQIVVAERVLAVQGWGAWPSCSRQLGLRGTPVDLRDSPTPPSPAASEVETPSTPSVPKDAPTVPIQEMSSNSYTVVTGDTLSKIAFEYGEGVSWADIYNANLAVVEDADLIYPGEVLTIPES